MNFKDLCLKRYSVRKYTDEPISDDDLNYILECVRLAPSAVNFQPWKFVVVRSEAAKAKLWQCYGRDWLQTAPLAIIAYKNTQENWVRRPDGKPHGDVDVSIAVEHLCLAAADRGLGTCWICNYDPAKLAELFPQPKGFEAVVVVPVGHIAPDCPDNPKKRKGMEEIVEII